MGRVRESVGKDREPGIYCLRMHVITQECWEICTTNGYFRITNTLLALQVYTEAIPYCWGGSMDKF